MVQLHSVSPPPLSACPLQLTHSQPLLHFRRAKSTLLESPACPQKQSLFLLRKSPFLKVGLFQTTLLSQGLGCGPDFEPEARPLEEWATLEPLSHHRFAQRIPALISYAYKY